MGEAAKSTDVGLAVRAQAAEATPPFAPPASYPASQVISPSITLQAPLSRRGRGPGLILVLDHYALIEASERHLDPPPLQKWAEEGFAVVQLLVPGKVEDGGEFPLGRALEVLKECKGFEEGGSVGVISYMSRIPFYVEEAACLTPEIKAIISYGGRPFTTLNESKTTLPPQLVHIPGPEITRRESFSITPEAKRSIPQGIIKTYRYIESKRESGWVLPSDEDYHKNSASIAHTRSLRFLKPLLNGPNFDLEAIWEEHTRLEFEDRDVDRTMATMVAQPYVNHIPTMTGGIGHERLKAFYTHHFIFSNPPDTSLHLVSRTIGIDRIVDEFIFSFTHTTSIPWLLPGIPPTGLSVSVPMTSIVSVRGDRLSHEHISWDQGTLLQQLNLLPEWVAFPHQIDGKEAESGTKFEVRLPVVGKEAAGKLVDEGVVASNELMERRWRVVNHNV